MPTSTLRWVYRAYAELSLDELYDVLRLRSLVFVVEQQCVFLELDGADRLAWHLLGYTDAAGVEGPAAYVRIFRPGDKYPEASIGRVVTHPSARPLKLGRALLAEAIRRTEALAPGAPIRIAAQQHLERFYAEFGFVRDGAPYDEDGIMHVEMVRAGARG